MDRGLVQLAGGAKREEHPERETPFVSGWIGRKVLPLLDARQRAFDQLDRRRPWAIVGVHLAMMPRLIPPRHVQRGSARTRHRSEIGEVRRGR
jgi:hypothetical protein